MLPLRSRGSVDQRSLFDPATLGHIILIKSGAGKIWAEQKHPDSNHSSIYPTRIRYKHDFGWLSFPRHHGQESGRNVNPGRGASNASPTTTAPGGDGNRGNADTKALVGEPSGRLDVIRARYALLHRHQVSISAVQGKGGCRPAGDSTRSVRINGAIANSLLIQLHCRAGHDILRV